MAKTGPAIEMFSEAQIAFQQEVRQHPELMMKIIIATKESGEEVPDEGMVIGMAAAEFNIIMDGMYSREQMDHMYEVLFHKLREKRGEIILPVSTLSTTGVQH